MFTHYRTALIEQLTYHVLLDGYEPPHKETPLEVPPTSPAPPPAPTKAAQAA